MRDITADHCHYILANVIVIKYRYPIGVMILKFKTIFNINKLEPNFKNIKPKVTVMNRYPIIQ